MSGLSDFSIHDEVATGRLMIAPFNPRHVQPASYDLTVELTESLALKPRKLYLLSSLETIGLPRNIQGQVHGRSSIGRKGVLVHFTSGFIDPGFFGQITLEVMALDKAFIICPGDRLAQISFTYLDRESSRGYEGRYQGQRGPTASRFEHGER